MSTNCWSQNKGKRYWTKKCTGEEDELNLYKVSVNIYTVFYLMHISLTRR